MRTLRILITLMFVSFISGSSIAQERFSAEFRPGLSFPLDKIGGSSMNAGFGFEFTAAWEIIQDVGVYAGWGWNKFDADNAFFTNGIDITETGFTSGIQFKHFIKNSSLSYLVRGGVVYNHLELEDNNAEFRAESKDGIGWQAEAGITLEIGANWDLRPTLRYRSLPGDIEVFNGRMSVDLKYISIGLGLAKKF